MELMFQNSQFKYETRRVNPWVGIKTRIGSDDEYQKVTQHEHDMK